MILSRSDHENTRSEQHRTDNLHTTEHRRGFGVREVTCLLEIRMPLASLLLARWACAASFLTRGFYSRTRTVLLLIEYVYEASCTLSASYMQCIQHEVHSTSSASYMKCITCILSKKRCILLGPFNLSIERCILLGPFNLSMNSLGQLVHQLQCLYPPWARLGLTLELQGKPGWPNLVRVAGRAI